MIIEFGSAEIIETEQVGIDALIEMMGYDPELTPVTDNCTFIDFVGGLSWGGTVQDAQAELDKILPTQVSVLRTLVEGLAQIRVSQPGWPHSRLM